MSSDNSPKDCFFCKATTDDHAYNYDDPADGWIVIHVCDGCRESRL